MITVRKHPDPGVVQWVDSGKPGRLSSGALALGELKKSVDKLPNGDKWELLQGWMDLVSAGMLR